MRLIWLVLRVAAASALCASPAVFLGHMNGWSLVDGRWGRPNESNMIELVAAPTTHITRDYVVVEKRGTDVLKFECVGGCVCFNCNMSDANASVKVPVLLAQPDGYTTQSCVLRFVAGGPDVTIQGVGERCVVV